MTTCSGYKALIDACPEQGSVARAELGAHLATCADCSGYQAAVESTQRRLLQLGARLGRVAPLDEAFGQLDARLRAARRQMGWALALAATCVAAPFAMALRGAPMAAVTASLLPVVAAIGLLVWMLSRERSVLEQTRRRDAGFYEGWQRELRQRIRNTAVGGGLALAWSVGLLVFAVQRTFPPGGLFVLLGTALILAFGGLRALLIEVRDLRSELALLGDADGG